ncbi:MAG: FHA domain-containing protein [Rhodospirillaceae bacterium]
MDIIQLLPLGAALLVSLFALIAAFGARAAAARAMAAAESAERTAASLVQLHRETERLHLAMRTNVSAPVRAVAAQAAPSMVADPAARPSNPTDATHPLAPSARVAPSLAPAAHPVPPPDPEIGQEESTLILSRPAVAARAGDGYHGMPILRVVAGAEQGQDFTLAFERNTIGRAGSNRVTLAESKASRTHAEIRYEGVRFLLRDMSSTNGTLRNGKPVTEPVTLEFGDIIAIGKTEMVFTCEGFDLKEAEPGRAIAAFERMLERDGNFIAALQILAFLLERDVARKRDAEAVWQQLKRLGG